MDSKPETKYVLYRDVFPFGKYRPDCMGDFPTRLDTYKEMDRIKNRDPFSVPYIRLYFREVPKSQVVTREFPYSED